MKKDIHPTYTNITVTCSCGNTFQTRSTVAKDLKVETCSSCHHFYTGETKATSTEGRVSNFNKKYGNLTEKAS
jgi:large subunit ribosomal protein L31